MTTQVHQSQGILRPISPWQEQAKRTRRVHSHRHGLINQVATQSPSTSLSITHILIPFSRVLAVYYLLQYVGWAAVI